MDVSSPIELDPPEKLLWDKSIAHIDQRFHLRLVLGVNFLLCLIVGLLSSQLLISVFVFCLLGVVIFWLYQDFSRNVSPFVSEEELMHYKERYLVTTRHIILKSMSVTHLDKTQRLSAKISGFIHKGDIFGIPLEKVSGIVCSKRGENKIKAEFLVFKEPEHEEVVGIIYLGLNLKEFQNLKLILDQKIVLRKVDLNPRKEKYIRESKWV